MSRERFEPVCIASKVVPPRFSGSGRRAVKQAADLHGRGIEAFVLNASNVQREQSGVELVGPDLPEWYVESDGRLSRLAVIPSMAWQLGRLFREREIGLVHCMQPGSWFALSAIAVAEVMGIPCVAEPTMFKGDDPIAISETHLGGLKLGILKRTEGIVSISPAIEGRARATGFEASRCFLVPNPVDCQEFRPASPEEKRRLRADLGVDPEIPLLLSVGAIMPRKGSLEIAEAFVAAQQQRDCQLALVGPTEDESYRSEVVDLVRRRGIEHRLSMPGYSERVSDWMRASDIYLFASRLEGLPNVLLEARACGLPVVARPIQGITDYVIDDGKDGYIVRSSGEMTARLVELLGDSSERRNIGARARRDTERRFHDSVVSRQYLEVYRNVCNQGVD